MRNKTEHVRPEKRLFDNLFEHREYAETLLSLSEGIAAIEENASRLIDDALLLLNEDRWTSGRFLLSTADEEIAKSYILMDMCRLDFSRHQSVLKRLCTAFYDHVYKYAYNVVTQSNDIHNMVEARREWASSVERWASMPSEENDEPELLHDTFFLREVLLYIDFLDSDQRWSDPKADTAEYTYSMGVGITGSQAALDRLRKSRDLRLYARESLSIMNSEFKKHYITEKTPTELVKSIHRKTAQQISSELGISIDSYYESPLNAWPLYHFVTMRE